MAVLHIVLPIPPGLLALNRKLEPQWRARKNREGRYMGLGIKEAWEATFNEAVLVVQQAVVTQRWRTRSSFVTATFVVYWPENKGDFDAPLKACSDALEKGYVVENDKLIEEARVRRVWLSPPGKIEIFVEDCE